MSNTRSIPGLLPALAVAGTVLTWSASFPAIRFALRELSPQPLASLRFALAALLVGAWLAWRRPRGFSARDYGRVALCGCLGIALYNILLNRTRPVMARRGRLRCVASWRRGGVGPSGERGVRALLQGLEGSAGVG